MKNRKYQIKAQIISNVRIANDYYRLTLNAPKIAQAAWPGQFVMLRTTPGYEPFLRRPFSIHGLIYNSQLTAHNQKKKSQARGIMILYRTVGKGTKILSKEKPGRYLDILGPLGNGFDYQLSITDNRLPVLVAGGIGVAPMVFLAQQLTSHKLAERIEEKPIVLIGAKTKKEILCKKEFASLGLNVKISSDNGSAGFKGKVTQLLKIIVRTNRHAPRYIAIFACGPKSMLQEIASISSQYSIPAQISLDEYMACGLGVCLGCMVNTRKGQKLVCRDGPVFDASRIKWYNK
ncbi:MAG: dihydroorotate dehydrogenase electron transfer subunit [Candidatus Omnitrophota bacterium]|jgi:dihydroorotate dehydrogenase electron transfer subunit